MGRITTRSYLRYAQFSTILVYELILSSTLILPYYVYHYLFNYYVIGTFPTTSSRVNAFSTSYELWMLRISAYNKTSCSEPGDFI